METKQSTDEQTRRRSGKSAIGNHKEEVEALQGGIDGERRNGKPAIRNRKEAELSESEVEREVQRLWERFAFATKKVGAKSGAEEEERRRIWLSHPAQCRKEKEKVGEAERKNQQTIRETLLQGTEAAGEESGLEYDDSDPMAVEAASFRRQWNYVWSGRFGSYEDISKPFFRPLSW
jgi:PAB1-binding protein PBP1